MQVFKTRKEIYIKMVYYHAEFESVNFQSF